MEVRRVGVDDTIFFLSLRYWDDFIRRQGWRRTAGLLTDNTNVEN